MPSFQHFVAVLPLPFRRCAVLEFRSCRSYHCRCTRERNLLEMSFRIRIGMKCPERWLARAERQK